MTQAGAQGRVGLYVNPLAPRRIAFQQQCAGQFERLYLADGAERAVELLRQQDVDLLIIDLERFEPAFDRAALSDLVARRGPAPTLLVCPYLRGGWLPILMEAGAEGAVRYLVTPLDDAHLPVLLDAQLECAPPQPDDAGQRLAAWAALQRALCDDDDQRLLLEGACAALMAVPGVIHASVFAMYGRDELRLEAQYPATTLNLARVLQRGERLLQSPLRHVFPGLLAACTGELSLLDDPGKCGEPDLAAALAEQGVQMVLGVPLPAAPGAYVRGALCLMFADARPLTRSDLAHLASLAQLVGLGMRLAALEGEAEQLRGRLTHMAVTDALTGVFNRRHGEHLLVQEIRRAFRYKLPLSLIAFDIDRFKAINDRHGHAVGDTALCTVAQATRDALRASDMLVRAGGAEFHIVVPHTSAADALKMAEKIRATIAATAVPGCEQVTVSLGVAQLADQESADGLIMRVAEALARAKRAGRNCVELAMA
jgi:diguanylate cyclase (GGDEF)-like protein